MNNETEAKTFEIQQLAKQLDARSGYEHKCVKHPNSFQAVFWGASGEVLYMWAFRTDLRESTQMAGEVINSLRGLLTREFPPVALEL